MDDFIPAHSPFHMNLEIKDWASSKNVGGGEQEFKARKNIHRPELFTEGIFGPWIHAYQILNPTIKPGDVFWILYLKTVRFQ